MKKKDSDKHITDTISPTKEEVYAAAKSYLNAGLSLIPIRADGTKMPACELLPRIWCDASQRSRRPWGGYRDRQPTSKEIRDWFLQSEWWVEYGIAILGGAVSGNLEIIDLDNWDVVEPWTKLVAERAPGLLQRLVRVKTPRPGLHAYYRCTTISGSQKLACVPDPDQDGKKPKTLIETKGEGGYCLGPPSPGACHKSGRCYQFVGRKKLTDVQTITPTERDVLLDCARSLNTWTPPKPKQYRRAAPSVGQRGGRPGDDFNRRADWGDILQPHGWVWAGSTGDGSDAWTRPGKRKGASATTNHAGSDLLYVFSSSATPFEEQTGYSKFHAFALLEFDGDFHAAAAALAQKGYGAKRQPSRTPKSPFDRYASYGSRSKRRPR
jgi:putative DNA primase/helicase